MSPRDLAEFLDIPRLGDYIKQVENDLQTLSASLSPGLKAPILRTLNSGGKRLRPILVIAAAAAGGKKIDSQVISSAAAIELVHQASLVHDDIIDNSKLRRNVPTIVAQEGLNTAVLVGDYLIAQGLEKASTVRQDIAQDLARAIALMCDGQAMELAKNYKADPTNSIYIETVRKKSAALVATACRMGGLYAGMSAADITALGSYGQAFGVAFQIIDDIIDQDFNKDASSKALAEAKRYCLESAKALEGLSVSRPTAANLAKLPQFYLAWAL